MYSEFSTELCVCCTCIPGERTGNGPVAASLTALTYHRCYGRSYRGDGAGLCGLELGAGAAILSSSQGSLPETVTFQCGPEGGEGGSHEGRKLERVVLAEGGAAKARGRSEYLTCLGTCKAASTAAVGPRGGVSQEARGQGRGRVPCT